MVTPEGAQAIHGLIKIMVYLFTVVGEEHESRVRHAPGTGQPCPSSVPGISSTYAGSRTFLRSDCFLVTHSKGAGQMDTPSIRAYFLINIPISYKNIKYGIDILDKKSFSSFYSTYNSPKLFEAVLIFLY